ncbi:MAG: hypothetical protein KGM39_06815, partial [Actinomycetales bacterium]|nr:hypothetical protein [Actinomycetales bacterium]
MIPFNEAKKMQMQESDFSGLPAHTRQFVERIHSDGLDRVRIHGIFVMLGLCAGAPDTQERLNELFKTLDVAIPVDRTKNIDEVVGDVYDGYDREIHEFCYRSGFEFNFREIKIPNVEKIFYIVELKDHGLFNVDTLSIEKLVDASRLYDAFIESIGSHTANRGASLVEAFGCGMFQIMLLARSDISGSRQIAELIKSCLPLIYSQYFSTLRGNSVEYFLGLERGQVPLLSLMQPMRMDYAQQMWGFQSSLFYQDQKPLEGVDSLTVQDWHDWVLKKAIDFDAGYPTQLVPF